MKVKKTEILRIRKGLLNSIENINSLKKVFGKIGKISTEAHIDQIVNYTVNKLVENSSILQLYLTITILDRLSTFAVVESKAFIKNIAPVYVKSETTFDFEVKHLWKILRNQIKSNMEDFDVTDQNFNKRTDEYQNPYETAFRVISDIVYAIGVSQFGFEHECKRVTFDEI